jgi:hypothetical protein
MDNFIHFLYGWARRCQIAQGQDGIDDRAVLRKTENWQGALQGLQANRDQSHGSFYRNLNLIPFFAFLYCQKAAYMAKL